MAKDGRGHLDFDVFYDGQDLKTTEFAIGHETIDGDTAHGPATFKSFGTSESLRYDLVCEGSE